MTLGRFTPSLKHSTAAVEQALAADEGAAYGLGELRSPRPAPSQLKDNVRHAARALAIGSGNKRMSTTNPVPPRGSKTRLVSIALCFMTLVLIVAVVLYIKYRPAPDDPIPIMAFVLIAAALGSVINESTRRTTRFSGTRAIDDITYISWKMLVAFVFACFLYLLFMSELLSGSFFPRFKEVRGAEEGLGNYSNMLKFMTECKPRDNADAAKAVVWAFIAGYAERFVPNLIQRLRSAAETSGESPEQGQGPGDRKGIDSSAT